jgi:hypothetical protein
MNSFYEYRFEIAQMLLVKANAAKALHVKDTLSAEVELKRILILGKVFFF